MAYELAAIRDGIAGFHIKTITGNVGQVVATEHEEYFPVFYSTEDRRSSAYGLNVADGGVRERALNRARDGNRMAVSDVFVLHRVISGDRRGFFAVMPVYRAGLPHDTLADRRRNLIGFVRSVYQIGTLVESILAASTEPGSFDLYLYDVDAGPDDAPLYVHPSHVRTAKFEPKPRSVLLTGPHWAFTFAVADTHWTLLMDAVPGALVASERQNTQIALAAAALLLALCLFVGGVLVVYIGASRNNLRRITSANRIISELARTDVLTGLANRRAFGEVLALSFARAQRDPGSVTIVLFHIDLDNFKDLNDTLGHSIGDLLLRSVARRLERVTRKTDVLARFGGDEFAILAVDASNVTDAGLMADKICRAIAEPYSLDGGDVKITASVGISCRTPNLISSDAMLVQADLALYRAKDDGRDCYRFYSPEMDREVRARVVIAREMSGAHLRGEFELLYQPQVDAVTRRIVGFEALVRWNHPTRGLLMPASFIAVAERTRFIHTLGQWTIGEVCRQIRQWRDQGAPATTIGVNISAAQFAGRSELVRDIATTLDRWGVSPSELELELTESVLMEATQRYAAIWEHLRKLGVRIAIDDFGTGYSSLTYLTRFPVTRLKIAQELVLRVPADSRNAIVVRMAIRLAHDLRIEVIAEGVESEAQANFLTNEGCEVIQGFYFSPAVNAEQALEMLFQGQLVPTETVKVG